jgi:hypothetical protein
MPSSLNYGGSRHSNRSVKESDIFPGTCHLALWRDRLWTKNPALTYDESGPEAVGNGDGHVQTVAQPRISLVCMRDAGGR